MKRSSPSWADVEDDTDGSHNVALQNIPLQNASMPAVQNNPNAKYLMMTCHAGNLPWEEKPDEGWQFYVTGGPLKSREGPQAMVASGMARKGVATGSASIRCITASFSFRSQPVLGK